MARDYRQIAAVPFDTVDIMSGAKHLVSAVVTPLDAERLLRAHNSENRRINQNTVQRYAAMMKNGEWDWCDGDEAIKFGQGGVLRNGQHRLSAQVIANVTGAYDIRTGVPTESYKVMDSGMKRVIADYFQGRDNAVNVSALANRLVFAARGYIEPVNWFKGAMDIPSRDEVIAFAEDNYDELLQYARYGTRIRDQHGKGGVAAYATALYISMLSADEVDDFVRAYVEGEDCSGITKQTVLKKLVDKNFKPRPHWYGGVTLMAYRAWHEGRGVKVLREPDVVAEYKRAVDEYHRLCSMEVV